MDLFHWRNLNSNVKFHPTKKQYFGRYLWRAEFYIKKANLATDRFIPDVTKHVKEKVRLAKTNLKYEREANPKQLHSWAYSSVSQSEMKYQEWLDVHAPTIERLRGAIRTHNNKLAKFRIEWHTVQVYTETEDELKQICEAICAPENIVDITGPKEGTEDALREGHVYMTVKHKYKILFRDGSYDFQTKQNILNQLKHRKDVTIPPALKRELGKKYPALWGGYIYADDDSIVTILSLIAPGIVGKIHPIGHFQ